MPLRAFNRSLFLIGGRSFGENWKLGSGSFCPRFSRALLGRALRRGAVPEQGSWSAAVAVPVVLLLCWPRRGRAGVSSSQLELFYWKDPSAWERHLRCAPQHRAMKSQRVIPCVDRETVKGIFPPPVCCAGSSQGCIPFACTWGLCKMDARGKISRNHMRCTPSKHKNMQPRALKVSAEPCDSVNQTRAEKLSLTSPVIAFSCV